MDRFPFPAFPTGWYVVGPSSDVAPGQVRTVRYLGQEIVLFRTAGAVLSALDRTCPHLGAHLGGGRVEGDCLRCPFHHWAFDGQGRCTNIPYAPKIPPRAAVRAWPLREQNGLISVHHGLDGSPPSWEIPLLEEEGWTANRVIRWELRSHPQEICENTVDSAHLGPVHDAISCRVVSCEAGSEFKARIRIRALAGHRGLITPPMSTCRPGPALLAGKTRAGRMDGATSGRRMHIGSPTPARRESCSSGPVVWGRRICLERRSSVEGQLGLGRGPSDVEVRSHRA
jgi:nitrite reductase/ring-hydroxylating ferredoxin subunit